jgi:hypothetical protein
MASPILYFRIGKKKIACLNAFTVGLYLICWGIAIWRGISLEMNIISIIWISSLSISILLLIVASSFIFYKVAPNINRVLLPFIMLAVLMISFLLNRQKIVMDVSIFFDIILAYLTPIFLFTILLIGAFQYDRGVGRQKRGQHYYYP